MWPIRETGFQGPEMCCTPSPSRKVGVLNVDYFFLYFRSLAWCSASRNVWNIFFQWYLKMKIFQLSVCYCSIYTNPESRLSVYSLSQFCRFCLCLYSSCCFTTSQLCRTDSSNLQADQFMWKTHSFLNSLWLDLSSLSDLTQLTPFHLAYFPFYLFILLLFSLLMRH